MQRIQQVLNSKRFRTQKLIEIVSDWLQNNRLISASCR